MSFMGHDAEAVRDIASDSTVEASGVLESGDEIVTVVVIDRRRLERECFAKVARSTRRRVAITAYELVSDWQSATGSRLPAALLLNVGSRKPASPAVMDEIREAVGMAAGIPVVVLADSEAASDILASVEAGARGYVPASVGVDAIVEAALLTSTGGSFLPASAVAALRSAIGREPARHAAVPEGVSGQFTTRQAAVADALRRGKANKIIAYELNMCESTVKVHIRTIMKKLRASNRTQAAFRLNTMFAGQVSA